MKQCSPQEVTQLLHMWCRGEQAALDKLVPLVQGELHRRAHRYMHRERPGHVLQTTALVNEAYLQLIDAPKVDWRDRAHFFAVSSNLMRRILVDFARKRGYQKGGGQLKQVSFSEDLVISSQSDIDFGALDDALTALDEFDPRKAKVVEMRFFGGLSVEEMAEILKISPQSVLRDWKLAKAFLMRELGRRGPRKLRPN